MMRIDITNWELEALNKWKQLRERTGKTPEDILEMKAVCEMSAKLGKADYHDYPDSYTPEPWHFHDHKCVSCGENFHHLRSL